MNRCEREEFEVFLNRENIGRYRKLADPTTISSERIKLIELLRHEESKLKEGRSHLSEDHKSSNQESTMKVKNAMHKGIDSVGPDTPVTAVAKQMRKDDVGAIPVWRNGSLIGIITDRDITCRAVADGRDLDQLTAQDVMTPHVSYCSSGDDLADAIATMKKKRIRRLPVVDDAKGVIGMLSLGDISRKTTRNVSGEILRAVSGHHV